MISRLRAWARRYTDEGRYAPVDQIFHWGMAALVIFQLGWGWYVGRMAVGGDKWQGYQVHADIGLVILLLAMLRIVWRAIVPETINAADRQGWQTTVAHITHILFYICFFLLPVSGWMMWSALGDGRPLYAGGILPWPQLPFDTLPRAVQWWILGHAETVHHYLVILLALLVPVHAGAALKHHFWNRNEVLEAMLPEIPDDEPGAPPHGPQPPEPRPA